MLSELSLMIYRTLNQYITYVLQLYCQQVRWHFWILCSWSHWFLPHCTLLDVSFQVWAAHSLAREPRVSLQCDVPCAARLHSHSWCPQPHSIYKCVGSERHPSRTKQALPEPCTDRVWSLQKAIFLLAHSNQGGSCLEELTEKSFLVTKREVVKWK